jgi:hypothetical protein
MEAVTAFGSKNAPAAAALRLIIKSRLLIFAIVIIPPEKCGQYILAIVEQSNSLQARSSFDIAFFVM